MADFADFTDFQIVFNETNVNSYDPRPKGDFNQFTDFQPTFRNNMTENYNVLQYDNFYLNRDV